MQKDRGGHHREATQPVPSRPVPRDTYILLRAFVDELHRCGMQAACTAPGSRSTPLVLSLVRDGRLRCYSHDFTVSIQPTDGYERSFTRRTASDPKVAIEDPLEGHIKLLPTYSDASIHDITAYLETLK